MTGRRARRWWVLPWIAIALGLVLVAWGLGTASRTVPAEGAPDLGALPAHGPALPVPRARPVTPSATVSTPPPGRPVSLIIPALGVQAPIDRVEAADGSLQVPDDPSRVGWWRDGPAPGAASGSALIAGHVDTAAQGPGALFQLEQLRPGDTVSVLTTSGEIRYVVAALRAYAKPDLPPTLADSTGSPRLSIVSCGGPFDRVHRSYLENIVVYAVRP